MNTRIGGLTAIELMVTLVVLAILLAIAAPRYRSLVIDSRMSADTNDFLTALQFARSEAVKRNGRVTVCKSSTGSSCATMGSWAQGWIVFLDFDGGSGGTYADVANADTLLRVHAALGEGTAESDSGNVASYMSFIPDGRSQLVDGTAQAGDFGLCVPGTSVKGRTVSLALGRAQVTPTENAGR